MRSSPDKRSKTPSPIKVKDFFTNPLHKIRQPAFLQVGFTSSALNTFVKNFTNRQNSKYISLASIKTFIKSFTNNNAKLMQMYEEFFLRNFVQKQPGQIQLDHFMDFFMQEDKKEDYSIKNIRSIYKDLQPLNTQNLLKKAQSLQISMTKEEARSIIKMVNYKHNQPQNEHISEETFFKTMLE